MSHSVKRAKSVNEQFRMAVPKDIRNVVGLTEWTQSLGTADPIQAAEKRGLLVAKHKELIRRIRADKHRSGIDAAVRLLDGAFDKLAAIRGSMDAAVTQQLHLLASIVIDSWRKPEISGEIQSWGDMFVTEPVDATLPVPSLDTEEEREIFRLRAEIIEGRGVADGIVYRELARLLLERRVLKPIWFAVSYMKSIEPRLRLDRDDVFDAVAEAYLRRLVDHDFASWPAQIHQAIGTNPNPSSTPPTPQTVENRRGQPSVVPPLPADNPSPLRDISITAALDHWRANRQPGSSAVTEARRAVARFVQFFGDMPIREIKREHVIEYRGLISDLPRQTELGKVAASGQTLRAVIDEARAARRMWEDTGSKGSPPPRLSPASIKKDVGAISAIIGMIQSDLGYETNVAAKIEIAGYGNTRKNQVRPRKSFTPEHMEKLFGSPLYTGCLGRSDADRAKAGDHIYQDELYWCFLFGAVGGPRLGEIGQIALADVHTIELERTFGGGLKGTCTYIDITGTGEDQHLKNEASERSMVVHQRLMDVGFGEYVQQRRAAGYKRLFDLEPDENGNFVKELSRRLNRYIDRAVTDDERYVFHSMRHEFTDRAELSQIPTRVANSIKGHANQNEGDKYGLASIQSQYIYLKNLNVGFIDWKRLVGAVNKAKLLNGHRPKIDIPID